MTNRLEIKWKLDGFVDEQRYYRQNTHIDVENLPAPFSLLVGSAREYIDYDIELYEKYYIIFSSVLSSNEKFSNQIMKYVTDNEIEYLVIDGVFKNFGVYEVNELWNSPPTIENDLISLNSNQWVDINNAEVFNFGKSLFEISFEIMQTNKDGFKMLMGANYYDSSYTEIGIHDGYAYFSDMIGGTNIVLRSSQIMNINTWYKLKLRRTSLTLLELLIDDVVVSSGVIDTNSAINFNVNNQGTRLFNVKWSNNVQFIGKVKRLFIKKA